MSARPANRMNELLEDCGNSVAAFYDKITQPDILKDLPSVGKKSMGELKQFFSRVSQFLSRFPDEHTVSDEIRRHLVSSPSALGLPEGSLEELMEKQESLGHFPFFAAIDIYLRNQPQEQQTLIDGTLKIHQDQELPEREEIAARLSLSLERIRQKRNKLIERLQAYFRTYVELGFVTENPYRYQMTHLEDDINTVEGTDFNLNFVSWVLGSAFEDITLIGDPIKSIGGYFDVDPFLVIVPSSLVPLFDFEGFMQDLEERLKERRINEENVSLRGLINAHLKVQYCEDELPEIDTTCRTILYLHYPVEVDHGNIILPANAHKPNFVIVEEIIRAKGQPMTLDEIIDEYMFQYPERDALESSIRSAINGNKNIVPIGRSSKYCLSEWHDMNTHSGTVREFAQEYLESLPERIAPIGDVIEFVLSKRPESNASSIVSNITLDPDKLLNFFFKDGERYFGFTGAAYPDEYFPLESDFRTSSANSVYYPKFELFVREHLRYPFTNGVDEEEKFLRLFWNRQDKRYAKDELDSHAREYFEKVEAEYGQYKIEKNEYEWLVCFAYNAKRFNVLLPEEEFLLSAEPSENLETWFTRNIQDLFRRRKYMPAYRVGHMERLWNAKLGEGSGRAECQ